MAKENTMEKTPPLSTRNLPIATKYGSMLLSMTSETRAYTHADHRGWAILTVDGTPCSTRVGLEVVEGKWLVTRTEAGNESPSSLDVRVPSLHSRDLAPAGKKLRDAVRAAVLEAVTAYLTANPEIVDQAHLARVEDELRMVENKLADAQARVKKLTEERERLAAECQVATADVAISRTMGAAVRS